MLFVFKIVNFKLIPFSARGNISLHKLMLSLNFAFCIGNLPIVKPNTAYLLDNKLIPLCSDDSQYYLLCLEIEKALFILFSVI